MNRRLIATALGLFAGILIAGGVTARTWLAADDTPGEGTGPLRWVNVIIENPDPASGLVAARQLPIQGYHPSRITISIRESDDQFAPIDDSPPQLVINADDGSIISDTLSPVRPAEAQRVIDSLTVAPSPPDVWPYVDSEPPQHRSSWGDVTFVEPDQSSGIVMTRITGYCEPPCRPKGIMVANGRSVMVIYADDGSVADATFGADADKQAFERLAAAVTSAVATPAPARSPAATLGSQ